MLSFSVQAAQDEIDLLIKRGKSILLTPRYMVPQVETVLRSESDWLREVYDTLILVFQRATEADRLVGTGLGHPNGATLAQVADYFEERMKNRLSLLQQLRENLGHVSSLRKKAVQVRV